jgi:hypothetical protein
MTHPCLGWALGPPYSVAAEDPVPNPQCPIVNTSRTRRSAAGQAGRNPRHRSVCERAE